MKNIIKEMQEPCLSKFGFYRDNNIEGYNSEGLYYSLNPKIGKGHYWCYAHDNLFSISIQNFILYKDIILEFQQPKYLSLNYYDSISKLELNPHKQIMCNRIRGHISDGRLYHAVYHKNIPIRSIGIELMPEYYEHYLTSKYPGEFTNPESAFINLNKTPDFPELIFLLRQLRKFHGTGVSAKMYYEGKVIEAISLIMEKNKQKNVSSLTNKLSKEDLEGLNLVNKYIDTNFTYDIHLEQLAQIACMGITKLKYTFKEAYNCTITECIQNKRIRHGEYLLANTDLNINQIAHIVGYTHSGHFSKLFKRNTGLLPREYRKLSTSK